MRSRRVAACLSLLLALNGPGAGGLALFAQQTEYSYDAGENRLRVAQAYAPVSAPRALQALDAARAAGRITEEDALRARALIERYGTSTPEVEAALTQLDRDLSNPNADARLTLTDLYDRMSPAARRDDGVTTYVSVISQTSGSQSVAVKSSRTGATLFYQTSVDIAPLKSRRVITRPSPDGRGNVVEAIIIVEEKGSAEEQRVVYNRKVHLLFKNLKKLYYDQCQLARKINNGRSQMVEGKRVPVFPPTREGRDACKLPNGEYQFGFEDKDLTAQGIAKGIEIYNQKRGEFDSQTITLKDNRTMNMRQYLAMLDAAFANNTLESLAWEDLEKAQRLAMKFYGENQLEMMQKYVLIQLASYFSQVTNSQPKSERDGSEQFDATAKTPEDLQKALDHIEQGRLEGYGLLTRALGLTRLSHEDQRYIPPDLMVAAGEAFAYVSYAVKAKQRAFNPNLSGEETDAALEEGQQWLKLAQIQLQTFEMHSLAIQMERLRDGQLRDHIGLRSDDQAGKAEATRLTNLVRGPGGYLARLAQVSVETKQLMLKQSVGGFFLSIQNAARGQLYSDTLRDRLRTLAAKALEMKSLYLAKIFEEVKNTDEFKGRSALDKLVNAGAYEQFLNTLQARRPQVARLAADLDAFARSLTALTGSQHTDHAIRATLLQKLEEFRALAARLGYDEMPDVVKVKEEGERHSIKHSQFFAALQEHATKMRVFDMLHELDQYLSRYASPDMPDSDGTTGWDKFVSFKWMDKAIDQVVSGFGLWGSPREAAINAGMKHFPLTREAFERLGGANKELRERILGLMAQQKYAEAYRLMQQLDPEGARRALAEWQADQLEKDPFEEADMVSFMSKAAENKDVVQAQAVVSGLFKHLQTYILGYTAAAAAFDAVIMTIATAGIGQLARGFVAAGRMAVGAARAIQAARAADAIADLTKIQRVIRVLNSIPVMNRMIGITRWAVNYSGKVLIAWGRNFRTTLELKKAQTVGVAIKQFAFTAVPNAARMTGRNMMIMAGASGGMQYGMYAMNPENSQYKSGWDAFGQGALGGAKFGASAGLMMVMTPVPASALGNGNIARIMTSMGNSPGPLNGIVSGAAKLIPRTSGSALAQQGLWGAASQRLATQAAMGGSGALRAAANMAVFGGAMADGALKYFLAAEVSKEIAEVAHFGVSRLMSHFGENNGQDQIVHGATSYVNDLSKAQHFGLTVSQATWLLIPVNSMHAPSEMRQQKEQLYGFSRIMREGRGQELVTKPSGETITYGRSVWQRASQDGFLSFFRGEGKTGTLTVNEQFREMANRMTSKGRPVAELAALSTVNGEVHSGRQRVGDLLAMMQGRAAPPGSGAGKPAPAPAKPATPGTAGVPAAAATPASASAAAKPQPRSVREFNRHLDKPETARPKTLYAYFTEKGTLQRVSTKGGGEKGVAVELQVKPDGTVELARSGKNLTKANEAALKRLGPEGVFKVGSVISEVNAARSAPTGAPSTVAETTTTPEPSRAAEPAKTESLSVDEVFITNEALAAWRKLLDQHLAKDTAMRRELITNKSDAVELKDPSTGRSFTVTGEALTKMRELASWQEVNRPASGLGEVVLAALELGKPSMLRRMPKRLWHVLTGRPLESPAEMIVADLRAGMEVDLGRTGRSARRRVASVREQIEFLRKNSKDPRDGAALERLSDVLARGGRPEEVIRQAKAELASLAQGVSPETLIALRRSLAAESKSQAVKTALELLEGVDGPGARTLREKLSSKDADTAVTETLAELAAMRERSINELSGGNHRLLERVYAELGSGREPAKKVENALEILKGETAPAAEALRARLQSGKTPEASINATLREILVQKDRTLKRELVTSLHERLSEVKSPSEVVQAARELLGSASGPAAERLREALSTREPGKAIEETLAELGRISEGAPVETLASLEGSLGGRVTSGDLTHFARTRMDARIKRSSGAEAIALQTLRRTLESDAYVKLSNERMVDAIFEYRRSGRTQADETKLAEAVDLLIGTWEGGVFGQMFKTRVEKNGERVWEIPEEFRFKDANGNAIPSFRQGQLDALRDTFLTIAKGKHQIYNLLQTSGGKTLLSFVLVSFLESFAKARGKEGAIIATANADLVAQGLEAYKAFFKGRKPSFELMTYSDLMVRQAMADEQGSLGPYDTHDVVMDEFDMVGMGTPLSLGQFNGKLSFAAIDPLQALMRNGVNEVWDVLFKQFGEGMQSLTQAEFAQHRKTNPELDRAYRNTIARYTRNARETLRMLDPMLAFEALNPSYRNFRRQLIESIPEAYAKERGMTREQVYIEMVREHRHAFGGFFKVGILEAKYGTLEKWVEHVFEGAFLAASEGQGLGKLYMKDPQRDAIIQFHNDQALDSLDTHFRTALELREGVSVTLDFENMAVTDFRKINLAAKDAGAVTIALSGTLPDGMRPFFQSIGVKPLGKGTDPNKAANIPHEIVQPRPELLARVEAGLKTGRALEIFVDPLGAIHTVGRGGRPEHARLQIEQRVDRVTVEGKPVEVARLTLAQRGGEKLSAEALERVGLQLDQLNASRVPNPEGTPFQLATAREGILRLLRDAEAKGTKNIAYIWLESLGKMESMLKDLDSHGITLERTSILTSPGSNFFLQERFMYKIKTEKNVDSIKAGEVDVVVLAGQGGLRGLEAPLQAYAGGEIKMFVTDSNTLADVSLLQLLGRIDRGRVPTNSKTTFVLLDDFGSVTSSRSYRDLMPEKVIDAARGGEALKLAELEKMMGREIDPATVNEIFMNQDLIAAKNLYRDYLTLRRIRETVPAQELAALAELSGPAQREAALKLMQRPEVMKHLVIEMRRLAEQDALRSSGINAPQPSLWQQFLMDAFGRQH